MAEFIGRELYYNSSKILLKTCKSISVQPTKVTFHQSFNFYSFFCVINNHVLNENIEQCSDLESINNYN